MSGHEVHPEEASFALRSSAPPEECSAEGHGGTARGEIIRQIERVSFREDPAGGGEVGGVGVENELKEEGECWECLRGAAGAAA